MGLNFVSVRGVTAPEHLASVTGSPAWQKVVADGPNFATGGVTILLSQQV
jgi:hypothetical protein